MKKGTKIWLWIALILSICTIILNAAEQRWLSVGIAGIALFGLVLLLWKQKKTGFYLLCCCNVLSFAVGAYGSIQGGTGVFVSILMAFIGSALIPVVTFILIHSQWNELK